MPSRLFDPEHLQVFDGDIVYADDLNKVSIAVDSAVEQLDQELQVVNAESILLTADAQAAAISAASSAATATTKADSATSSANTATTKANSATSSANTATSAANTATTGANTATTKASEAAASAAAALISEQNAAASEAQLDAAITHMNAEAPHSGHLVTGSHGLGSAIGITDANDAITNGFYQLGVDGANSPQPTNVIGILVIKSSTRINQLATGTTGITFRRTFDSGTWKDWVRVIQGTPGSSTATSTNEITGTSHTHAVDSTIARSAISLTAGDGLSGGGTLAADRTFTLGTPGSSTATSTNATTSTSHTHAVDGTIARAAISLTAGNGLSGGGDLSANRTLTLGTPGSTTATSTNATTTTSHTHAADSTLARSAITITAGNGLTGGGNLTANRTLTLGTPSTLSSSSTDSATATSHTHGVAATTSHSDVSVGSFLRAEDLALVTQAEAEAGTATTNRRWTALRVRQAAEEAIRNMFSNPGDFSIAPGGSFTSGTLKGVKVGNLITISWNSMGHASASSPSSGTAIPAAYRPPDTRSNVYYVESGSGVSYLAEIDSSGILTIKYYGSGGGAFSRTATFRGSISYIL
jgi:hypothetical protein